MTVPTSPAHDLDRRIREGWQSLATSIASVQELIAQARSGDADRTVTHSLGGQQRDQLAALLPLQADRLGARHVCDVCRPGREPQLPPLDRFVQLVVGRVVYRRSDVEAWIAQQYSTDKTAPAPLRLARYPPPSHHSRAC